MGTPAGNHRKRLIVNADDLGRTPGINAGTFEAHRRGIVTSATLMVGYPAAAEAGARLDEYPHLGVGLHVQLTGGHPTLPAEDVPSLVDGAGRLARKPDGLGDLRADEVLAEVRNQLSLFVRLTGRLPTHLDSHHHSHRHPTVLGALVTVARERGLPVRRSSPEIAATLVREGIATTDTFVERFYAQSVRVNVLRDILSKTADGITEVMCHPGHVDGELRAGSTYVGERETEIDVLCDPDVKADVTAHGIELVHFGSIWS